VPLCNRVGLGLLRGDDRFDVLEEINAAFFARAALPLFVLARGTLVTQRRMATPAKPRDVSSLGSAFRAIHIRILPRSFAGRLDPRGAALTGLTLAAGAGERGPAINVIDVIAIGGTAV
jgi:hypothetical protein